jgi:Dolichyl-phosphate-mannose-protein mannosyltransferase
MNKFNVKIIIAICLSIFALGLGMYFNDASVFLNTGYYFILASFLLWLFSLFRIFCVENYSINNVFTFISNNSLAFIIPLIIMASAVLISAPEIKILSDEVNLIATSKSMYRDHQIHMVMVNVVMDFGFSQDSVFSLDKRGLFFPFLLSVVHTFIGYDPHNGFIVNIIAGYFLLLMFYFFLVRWVSKESALLGMVILAAFPIIMIYTLSSGFEILNVLFIIICFYLFDRFLVKKNWRYAEALLLSLVLLSKIRYEAVFFAIILLPILLLELKNQPARKITFLSYVTPFLFIPVLWHRLLTTDYQLPANYTHVFGIDNLIMNFPKWWMFFSGDKQSYGVIGFVFFISIIGLIMIVINLIYNKRSVSDRVKTMFAVAFVSYMSVALIIMSFWSGSLIDGYVSRLSITFIPLIIFFALIFVDYLSNKFKNVKKFFPLIGVFLLLFYWPEVQKNTSVVSNAGYQKYHLAMNFIKTNYSGKVIAIIEPHTTWFNIHGWGSLTYNIANLNIEEMHRRLSDNSIDEILVLQNISNETGEIDDLYKLNDQYKLEELYVRKFRDETSMRISKVLQ